MSVRVDKWLWSVRVFPTRTAATAACSAGRVAVNGEAVKPATRIGPGDRVSARRGDRMIVYVVVDPIERRVSASVAAACYVDESPPVLLRPEHGFAGPDGGARERGAGRPTKRDRRQIDRLHGRE
ncbi:MAG: RNA-binding S4 domain-containing protein [Acidimicrobiales bacterium]